MWLPVKKRLAVDLPTTCFKIMAREANTFKHITACSPASIVYSKSKKYDIFKILLSVIQRGL